MKIAERCLVTPEKWDGPKPWKASKERWPRTCLMIHTTFQDARGEPLRIGVGIVHTPRGNRVHVFYAEGYEDEARDLAASHGTEAIPVQDFVRRFVKYYAKKRAVVAGWALGVDLSRMAVGWGTRNTDHFTLYLASRPPKEGEPNERFPLLANGGVRDSTAFPVVVKMIDGQRPLISFSSIKWKEDGKWVIVYPRARPLDLRTWAGGLAGTDFGEGELAEVCSLFDVTFAASGDLVERTLILTKLYDALLEAHDSLELPILPSRVYGPGSYTKALLASREIESAPEMSRADADRAMRASFGGESFSYVRRYPVPIAPLDYNGCFPIVDILGGSTLLYGSKRIVAQEIDAAEATSTVERIGESVTHWLWFDGPAPTRDDRQCLGRLLFELIPNGDVLPHHPYGREDDTMRVGPITSTEPLFRMGADVVRSILKTGKTPHIVRAWRYVPEGKRGALGNPSLELRSLRERVEHDMSIPANERQWRGGWAKSVGNALVSGLPIEVHDRNAHYRERVRIGAEEETGAFATVEEPGPFYCPIIASGVQAGARLLQYLCTALAEEHLGTVAYTDTDAVRPIASKHEGQSVSVPGLGTRKALSIRDVNDIRWKIEELLGEVSSELPEPPRRIVMSVQTEIPSSQFDTLPASYQFATLPNYADTVLPSAVQEPRLLKLEREWDSPRSGFRLDGPYLYAVIPKRDVIFYFRYRAPHIEIRLDENGIPRGVVVGEYVPDGIVIASYSKHGLIQYMEQDGWQENVWEHILSELPWDDIIDPNAIAPKPLSFGDAPHLAIARATRLDYVRAIPGMRPMARMVGATPFRLRMASRLSRFWKHDIEVPPPSGYPIAAYYESFDPFSGAGWHDYSTTDPLALVSYEEWDFTDETDDGRPLLAVEEMGRFVSRFGRCLPKRAVTLDGDPCKSDTVGALVPAPTINPDIVLVGRLTHAFANRGMEEILPVRGTTTYREAHRIENVLAFLRRRARAVGASQVVDEAESEDIPERTTKRALYSPNGYRPNKETRKAFVRLAERLAEEDGFSIEESILQEETPRVCQGCNEPLVDKPKWHNSACRHRAYRARKKEIAR